MPTLDVIIPVKNRPLAACVTSLQRALSQLGHPYRLLICDGGSTQPEVVDTLATLAAEQTVEILRLPMVGFNKAALLNQGIRQAQAEVLLISDADIVWNAAAIAALLHSLQSGSPTLGYVADVAETEPQAPALSRPRYGYRIEPSGQGYTIHLEAVTPGSDQRPGCGLVCAHRQTFQRLGGYKEIFQGWGWEDQDLLIRAELIGLTLVAAGRVIHSSHPDTLRNQFCQGLDPRVTRDHNIRTCLQALQRGELAGNLEGELGGDLPTSWPRSQPRPTIQIQWPQDFSRQPMRLSLITIYRRRPLHLETQLTWWQRVAPTHPDCEWIVIEADATPTPGLAERLRQHRARYGFLANDGTLHKTKALNLGLRLAQGTYLTPLDVDLIPLGNTLEDHLHLASLSGPVLITGYRLMAANPTVDLDQLPEALALATIAPEDQPTALRKHLLKGEKFGVLPFFHRQRLLEIQGWDEAYVGWGAEDQDLIERYLGDRGYLCRSPQLVYLHLHHEAEPDWREEWIIAANRKTYYGKRSLDEPT